MVLPLFSQAGQLTRAGFIKRVMNYTCRDYAFNCTAGIRRHVEHLVELKEEHRLYGVRVEWDVVSDCVLFKRFRVPFMVVLIVGYPGYFTWMS